MACWAHWAKTSNIGLPYVFRCHICFNLIKLDKDFVEIVHTGKEPAPDLGKKVDLVSYLRQLEAQNKPKVVQEIDPLAVPADEYDTLEAEPGWDETYEKPQLGPVQYRTLPPETAPMEKSGITFSAPEPEKLQPIPQPTKPQPKPQPEQLHAIPQATAPPAPQPTPQPIPRTQPPKEEEKPIKRKRRERRPTDVTIIFCPSCSQINTSLNKICKNCGHPL